MCPGVGVVCSRGGVSRRVVSPRGWSGQGEGLVKGVVVWSGEGEGLVKGVVVWSGEGEGLVKGVVVWSQGEV